MGRPTGTVKADEASLVAPDPVERGLLERWRLASSKDGRAISEAVRETLVGAITERQLPPGWRLSEERLAALFNVSRTPIREAILVLASSNMAKRDSRGSLRVGSITPEQILDLYAVRRSLAGLSASLAATVSKPTLVIHLKELNRLCRQALAEGNKAELVRRNADFHSAIATSTGNEMLIRFTEDVSDWMKRIPTTTLTEVRAPIAFAEHDEIIAAIENRQPDLAQQLAEDHNRRAERIRIQMLFEQPLGATPIEAEEPVR